MESKKLNEYTPLLQQSNLKVWNHPEEQATWISKFTFSWLSALLKQGATSPLTQDSLWPLRNIDKEIYSTDKLRQYIEKYNQENESRVLWKAIFKTFKRNMIIAGIFKFFGDGFGYLAPICLNEIIRYLDDPSTARVFPLYYGYVVSGVLFTASILQTLCLHQHHHRVIREAIHVRSAVTMLVFNKALTLSTQQKSAIGSGSIMNLATTDANRLLDLFYFVHYAWSSPLQLLLGLCLLVLFLGPAAFVGIILLLFLLPTSAWFSARSSMLSKKLLSMTDNRLSCVRELLQNMKIIKMYAWESHFISRVASVRAFELNYLRKMAVWDALSSLTLTAGSILVSLASFTVYILVFHQILTPSVAFTAIALFNIFQMPLSMLPRIFSLIFQANVSVNRLQSFLLSSVLNGNLLEYEPETTKNDVLYIRNEEYLKNIVNKVSSDMDVIMMNIKFELKEPSSNNEPEDKSVDTNSTKKMATGLHLKVKTLEIPRGKLSIVIGEVGAGKSSLLAALLGELVPHSESNMSTALVYRSTYLTSNVYAAQSPYLVSGTILNNILFGMPLDQKWLNHVIRSCELSSDLKNLPDGLYTEIGESGVTLSGGQKARVSMARAMYRSTTIFDQTNFPLFLFDDTLSALDHVVSRKIFSQCFASNSEQSSGIDPILQRSTRVLATHSLEFAPLADHIIVLKDQQVIQSGSFEILSHEDGGVFAEMWQSFIAKDVDTTNGNNDIDNHNHNSVDEDSEVGRYESDKNTTKLITIEGKTVGTISWSVYLAYWRACGIYSISVVYFFFAAAQVATVMKDLWLTHWMETPKQHAGNGKTLFYLRTFAYLGAAVVFVGFFADISSRFNAIRASRRIHKKLLLHVTKATMRFFDTTPTGRIINRFANDMTNIDQKLNPTITSLTTMLLALFSMLIIQSTSAPILVLMFVPIFFVYRRIQKYYRKSCAELQRLDNISKSPVYEHFSQSLNGLMTIRAYNLTQSTVDSQGATINLNTQAFLSLNLINRWLGVRLETLGAIVTVTVALLVSEGPMPLPSALAGLLLSYAQSLTTYLNWIVRTNIDLENIMNSVERTQEYSSELIVSTEKNPCVDLNCSISEVWPEKGDIKFSNVNVKYDPLSTEFVLKGISFSIKAGEKIGICGRTGAGKSSLLLALFRLVPHTESGIQGEGIFIDNIPISSIPLHRLRSSMAIIPQEPILFAASIRENIDPTGVASDEEIWRVLRKTALAQYVQSLPMLLETQVVEGGENLSMGERQLFCLARAMIREPKILCLDEATSSMSHTTDAFIQKSIRKEFSNATVITIAHRVKSILDYDKIIALHNGQIMEFDSPIALQNIEGGIFASMLHASK